MGKLDKYIMSGTPIIILNTKPNLHTKDTGSAMGKIGNYAILSELDGLNPISIPYKIERLDNNQLSFVKLLKSFNKLQLYNYIMKEYYIKSIEELKLEYIYTTLYNINIYYSSDNKWIVTFMFLDIIYKINITSRGSTTIHIILKI